MTAMHVDATSLDHVKKIDLEVISKHEKPTEIKNMNPMLLLAMVKMHELDKKDVQDVLGEMNTSDADDDSMGNLTPAIAKTKPLLNIFLLLTKLERKVRKSNNISQKTSLNKVATQQSSHDLIIAKEAEDQNSASGVPKSDKTTTNNTNIKTGTWVGIGIVGALAVIGLIALAIVAAPLLLALVVVAVVLVAVYVLVAACASIGTGHAGSFPNAFGASSGPGDDKTPFGQRIINFWSENGLIQNDETTTSNWTPGEQAEYEKFMKAVGADQNQVQAIQNEINATIQGEIVPNTDKNQSAMSLLTTFLNWYAGQTQGLFNK